MIPAEAVEAAMEAFLSESVARKGELGAQPMALLSALESAAPHIEKAAYDRGWGAGFRHHKEATDGDD